MHPFNLPLTPRLLLAALSGALTYPANKLDTALGPDSYPPVFSWWLILHGLTFGLLVLAPFVATPRHRPIRIAALCVASILIYDAAIRIPDLFAEGLLGDTGEFAVAGTSGALLSALAVRVIASRQVTVAYWAASFVAGLAGGLLFAQTFQLCDWDRCNDAWSLAGFVSGWISWQSLVCVALFLGSVHEARDDGAVDALRESAP